VSDGIRAGSRAPRLVATALLPLIVGSALPLTAAEPEASLEECRRWQRQIERHTALRRRGGTAARMESLRQARRRYEERFRAGRCHRWGRALRED
jgi:hypothetical protein